MERTCQRCHESLREEDRYCSVCGLPQLIYVEEEAPVVALSNDSEPETVQPAGFVGANLGSVTGIAWRPALRAAIILAIPASVLSSGLTPVGLICMSGAAAWAVSMYAKNARSGRLSMGSGARIGLITGILASWLTLGEDGIRLWFTRFVLHQGSQIDSLWTSAFEQNQQMIAQMGMATAQSAQMAQTMRDIMLSTNGRAGIALSGVLTIAILLVFFAILGGVIGARLFAQPKRPRA